ncbi:MAG: cytochrome c3 family protein, partial [Terriglobales bacterium]
MAQTRVVRRKWRTGLGTVVAMLLATVFSERPVRAADQPGAECLACHGDKSMSTTRAGKTVSLFVDGKRFATSVHASFGCTGCHADLEGKDFPHSTPARVQCGTCHSSEQELYAKSLHGKAIARGDPLAPRCVNCHGNHDIYPVKDSRSAVAPLKVPFVCGKCHREGTPVQLNRSIPQDNILENYSESIHGEALLKKGLAVAPN